MSNKFTIGLVQLSLSKNPDENLKKAISWIEQAAKAGAQVICLPELFRSHYFCQTEDINNFSLAEIIPGSSTDAISSAAKKLKVSVVVPIFEKRSSGVYHNSLVVINSDGKILGTYRKMHIPDDPGFYEKYYFAPGDLGFKNFDTSFGKIGTLICWDQWYPEAARLTALQGSAVLFYPTAIGWHPYEKEKHGRAQYESWLTIQRGHAVANGVYVAAVNRVGLEKVNDEFAIRAARFLKKYMKEIEEDNNIANAEYSKLLNRNHNFIGRLISSHLVTEYYLNKFIAHYYKSSDIIDKGNLSFY